MIRYAILGPVELCDGERGVAVRGRRQVALLALLLVNANRALLRDRLIDALWSDRDPGGAVKRLQVAIVRLRSTLDAGATQGESALRTVAGGYLLAVAPGQLDAAVFQELIERGRRALEAGEAARAGELLGEALAMWRGPALGGAAYEEFAQPEIRRLEELRLSALEARGDCQLQLGRPGQMIGELEALVAAHPGRERLSAQLMLALYRCGRQGDALAVYARAREYLSGELGLEPAPALRDLQAAILDQSPSLQRISGEPGSTARASAPMTRQPGMPSGDGAAVAAASALLALPRSLQAHPSSRFVGREAELAHLRARWTDVRGGARSVVVIGGEPGIGKTRLAGELAHGLHREGALVLYGRCDEGLAVPYQPFVEALRPFARAAGPDRLRGELGDLSRQLGRLWPEHTGHGAPARGDPESERCALFESVAALIEAMTRERPALLVLDDLHWAATPTLLLLRHVIRSERPLGLLVLCTYRETELDPSAPLAQLLAELHRDDATKRLSMRGLDEASIGALLQAVLGHPLDDRALELVPVLEVQTAGNPLFLRELLADLAESGTIAAGHPGRGVTAAQLHAPEGLRQVIGHRVARLSAPAGRALRVAAVAGQVFSFVLGARPRARGDHALPSPAESHATAAGPADRDEPQRPPLPASAGRRHQDRHA